MKLKHLQEARLDLGQQNEVVAKWLLKGIVSDYDYGESNAHRMFIGIITSSEPEGGLENAVKTIQEWNTVVKFIHKYTNNRDFKTVSPQQLEKWVEYWKAT